MPHQIRVDIGMNIEVKTSYPLSSRCGNYQRIQAMKLNYSSTNLPNAITGQDNKLGFIIYNLYSHIRFRTKMFLQAFITKCPRHC